MKILGGTLKGRTLNIPKELKLRPTKEQVREAIFSMLHSITNFENLEILELYAGSGALGIEAVSRGAKKVTFVEIDFKTVKVLNQNIEDLELSKKCVVIKNDVEKFILRVNQRFSLVFCDPPYLSVDHNKLINTILKKRMGEFLVYELPTKYKLELTFVPIKDKIYGDTRVLIFEFKE